MKINSKLILLVIMVLMYVELISMQIPEISLVEFDESKIERFLLNIKWTAKDSTVDLDRYLVTFERKYVDYKPPLLITRPFLSDAPIRDTDDYNFIGFVNRRTSKEISELSCAFKCFNGTSSFGQDFDCNIYKFKFSTKLCYMFQYNESKVKEQKNPVESHTEFNNYETFLDECEVTFPLCRRINDYANNYTIEILPNYLHKFKIAVRNKMKIWSNYYEKEFKFDPNITIDVTGDLSIGKSVTLDCSINLDPTIITSIKWLNGVIGMHKKKLSLEIKDLKYNNNNQDFTCEVVYQMSLNIKQTIRKTYVLKLNNPQIFMNIEPALDILNQDLTLNLNFNSTINMSLVVPERLIISYFDGKNYSIVHKYHPFQESQYDNLYTNYQQVNTVNEIQCQNLCLRDLDCNHYVFNLNPNFKVGNCLYGSKDRINKYTCGFLESCHDLLPIKNIFSDYKKISIKILPNKTYKFKVDVKFKQIDWIHTEVRDIPPFSAKIELIEIGNKTIFENKTNIFELLCKINLKKINEIREEIIFEKNGEPISKYDNDYIKYTNYTNNIFVHSYLKFEFDHENLGAFDANYSCVVKLKSNDLDETQMFFSDFIPIEFHHQIDTNYTVSAGTITFPVLPGNKIKLPCLATSYPLPQLVWKNNDEDIALNINTKNISDSNFVHLTKKDFTVVSSLLFNLNKKQNNSQIKCLMNNSILIRDYKIVLIDHTPKINAVMNLDNINEFKVTIDLKMTSNSPDNVLFNEYNDQPIKYKISYLRVNPYTSESRNIDLSRRNTTIEFTNVNDLKTLSIGTLFIPNQNSESCRYACFYNPLCSMYLYLRLSKFCMMVTKHEWKNKFQELIISLKNNNSNIDYELISFTTSIENIDENNYNEFKDLIEKHNIHDCKDNNGYFSCYGLIEEIKNPYLIENLWPNAIYTIKVEAINLFGKTSFTFEPFTVPFPLNDIKELFDQNWSKYSLFCETTLNYKKYLKFKWYKNDIEIDTNNNEYEIKLKNDNKSSELVFIHPNKNETGLYTCSLIFEIYDEYTTVVNKTFETHIKYGPLFENENENEMVKVNLNQQWNKTCSVEGWPLPNIDWFYNNEIISTNNENVKIYDYIKHRYISKEIVIKNVSEHESGNYLCKINGDKIIKNISLEIENAQLPTAESLKKVMIVTPVGILILIVISVIGVYLFIRKSKIINDSPIRYSHIDDDRQSISTQRMEEAIQNLIPEPKN